MKTNRRMAYSEGATGAQLWTLYNNSLVTVFVRGPEGDYPTNYVSDNVRNLLGHEPHEFLDELDFWRRHLHPDDMPRVYARLRELVDIGKGSQEYRFRHRDGRYRWIYEEQILERDPAGKPLGIIGLCIDITERKRMEEALVRSKERLETAIRAAGQILYERDPETGAMTWSGNVAGMLGYELGELGDLTHWLGLIHPDDRAGVERELAYVKATESPVCMEYRVRDKDGNFLYVEDRGDFYRDSSGEISNFVGVIYDISEHKRTEQALRKTAERLAAERIAHHGYWEFCPKSESVFWSEECFRIFGLARKDSVPGYDDILHMIHAEDRASFDRALKEAVRSKSVFQSLFRVIRPDGSVRDVLSKGEGAFGQNGEVEYMSGVMMDITEVRRLEQEYAHAKEEAERANRAKSRLLAAASHDLRQPLQALHMFIDVLAGGDHDPKTTELIGKIQASADALGDLLRGLLDISKLEAGLVVPREEDFPVAPLLSRLVDEFEPLAKGKGLRLRAVGCSAVVRSDPTMLERILRNLLSNAARYTHKGRILLGCRRHGDSLRIQVWDSGIGIPEDQLDLVFQEYHQVDNPARSRHEGLGLGLAIVERMSKLLGHDVSVSSVVGRGSVFSVDVPIADDDEAKPEPAKPAVERDVAGAHILVLDDEKDILDGMKMRLEGWGYRVTTATCCGSALGALKRTHATPDLIVADYRLDKTTGGQAIRLIRQVLGADIPGILVTGDTAPERLQEATASGFQLLHKPVQAAKLRGVIARILAAPNGVRGPGPVRLSESAGGVQPPVDEGLGPLLSIPSKTPSL